MAATSRRGLRRLAARRQSGDDPLARRTTSASSTIALRELPVGFREVVVLRDIEDLSYKEIAAVAGLPIGTVMSRLARGRKIAGEAPDAAANRSGGSHGM